MLMGLTCSVGGRKPTKQQMIILLLMMMMATTPCETSSPHSGLGEDSILLGCDTVNNGKYLPTFTTMVVPSISGPVPLDYLMFNLLALLPIETSVTIYQSAGRNISEACISMSTACYPSPYHHSSWTSSLSYIVVHCCARNKQLCRFFYHIFFIPTSVH
jgi:hypothetical protein